MPSRQQRQYWDACIFIAWLNAEDDVHGVSAMEGIRQMVRDLDAARVTAFTSVLNEDRGPHPIKNTGR